MCAEIETVMPLYKGCNPYGQLLYGMLQVPSAVHTLYTRSIAEHGRKTGAYNTLVATKWLD